MYYGPAVHMRQSIGYLFEDEFSIGFLKFPLAFNKSEEVTTPRIFHDHQQVLARFEHLQQADDIRVLNLL